MYAYKDICLNSPIICSFCSQVIIRLCNVMPSYNPWRVIQYKGSSALQLDRQL